MEHFFDLCVYQIVDLIRAHQRQIEDLGSGVRTKNVFLVGGFGESIYLQRQIMEHLNLAGFNLRIPDTSWTAVVRGAVICGIEKLSSQNLIRAKPCRHHYGINVQRLFNDAYHSREDAFKDPKSGLTFARGEVIWFLNKGDLVLSNTPLEIRRSINLHFSKDESRVKVIPIYRYSDDDRPSKFYSARKELTEVCSLSIDVSKVPSRDYVILHRMPKVFSLVIQLVLSLFEDRLTASVWRNQDKLLEEQDIMY
ncbi:unnamed protein product [Periconia digitata]|uniref:Uncharacterized protein n=1 Tax=Periconia digitata TaxID=1303443 RepID=A0A9W4U9N8_9PLEO|nr:unnamed protein product [Periconia digitata]